MAERRHAPARKVAGILAEARDGAVVLGVGVNVNQTRARLPERGRIAPHGDGREWDRDQVLDAVLAGLARRYEQWLAGSTPVIYGLGRATSSAAVA